MIDALNRAAWNSQIGVIEFPATYDRLLLATGSLPEATPVPKRAVGYLRQGNVSLVLEALKERGHLRRRRGLGPRRGLRAGHAAGAEFAVGIAFGQAMEGQRQVGRGEHQDGGEDGDRRAGCALRAVRLLRPRACGRRLAWLDSPRAPDLV